MKQPLFESEKRLAQTEGAPFSSSLKIVAQSSLINVPKKDDYEKNGFLFFDIL
jgi:hypothetical protein